MSREASGTRAVLFDFGGTLDAGGVHWYERFRKLFARHMRRRSSAGSEAAARFSPEHFYPLCTLAGENLAATPGHECMSFADSVRTFARHIAAELQQEDDGLSVDVAEDFLSDSYRYLHVSSEVLRQLKDRSYALALVTNNFGNARGWCRDVGIEHLFDTIVDSSVVGVSKPSPEIFVAALDEMEVEPERTVHVGDSFSADVTGATNAGITPIWLNVTDPEMPGTAWWPERNGASRPSTRVQPEICFRVDSLAAASTVLQLQTADRGLPCRE